MVKQRRDEQTIINLILEFANRDDRIKGVMLNGSRVSPQATKDILQDYDIVYFVKEVEPFVENQSWIKRQFGEILIMQTPDEMDEIWPKSKDKFTYLMLFKDWNRIDLTFFREDKVQNRDIDGQTIILLDKDNCLRQFDFSPSDKDYLPQPITKKQFQDCCNEFWWLTTYVAKGIWRQQLTYAKTMEQGVREELIKLLIWYAGTKTNFQKIIGMHGKYLQKYIEADVYNSFKLTYVDANYDNMWNALFRMCDIFDEIAARISIYYEFTYDQKEYKNVRDYLNKLRLEQE